MPKLYLLNKYTYYDKYAWRGEKVEIIISNSSDKPIYEQICMQVKSFIMDGTLSAGEALPSMRALAKDLHISVITVQRAYEDLTRDGFIETVSGKGSFVASQNREFIQEEQLRIAEELLQKVAEIGRAHGISLEQMTNILKLFYEEYREVTGMDNNILVQNLCKQFEGFSLDNVSFKVPKGRIVGFIGENGAGKSTTINLILNELNKDSGQIQVFGIDHTIPTVKDNIGVVFDECNFHDVFTATDIEKILKGIYKTWDSNLFLQYLKKFKIPTKKKIGAFSKGMKMKLSIICAMAHRPQLLILDEATTGLDPIVRDEVLDLFLEFIQDEDCSIFFSSHITSDIQKIADYVILIHQGKIIFEEKKDNLVYNYGVAKCGKEKFSLLSSDDYIIHRTTNMSVECLVHNKEAFKRKYKNIIVDNATLEDIILLYVKGGTSCED